MFDGYNNVKILMQETVYGTRNAQTSITSKYSSTKVELRRYRLA